MRFNKKAIMLILFFILGITSRVIFSSKAFTHLDSILYAIGTFNYSLQNGTPPSGGYFLYIMSAKLLNLITSDPHTSLMIISVFYSGLIAALIYYFGYYIGGNLLGIASALLFLTSPVMWFKGITVWPYLNSGFFILLFTFFCYKAFAEDNKIYLFLSSFFLALLVGVRPQEIITVFPLYLFILLRTKVALKEKAYAFGIFLATNLIWFIPYLKISGGLRLFLEVLNGRLNYLKEDSVFGILVLSKFNNHIIRMSQFFERTYFLGILPLIYYFGRFFDLTKLSGNKKVQFFIFWLFPALFYNLFVQFGEIGHGMSWGLCFFLIIGEATLALSNDVVFALKSFVKRINKGIVFFSMLASIISVNLIMFFHDFKSQESEFYKFEGYRHFNYVDMLRNNRLLIPKINFIKKNLQLKDTLIISSATFGYQVMYYLPEATVLDVNIFKTRENVGFTIFKGLRPRHEKMNQFIIPEGILRVVIFDDAYMSYVVCAVRQKGTYVEVYPGNKLQLLDVKMGDKISFGHKFIRFE